jgi:hypothetical protein
VDAEPVPVPDDTGQAALDLDWIVSVDDHVIEPPRVWLDRLPRGYHDVAPRIVTEADGQEFRVYEDRRRVTRRAGRRRRPPARGHHGGGLPVQRHAPGVPSAPPTGAGDGAARH